MFTLVVSTANVYPCGVYEKPQGEALTVDTTRVNISIDTTRVNIKRRHHKGKH
jgi:hypothetical protein